MKPQFFLLFSLITYFLHAQDTAELIPYPNKLTEFEGQFEFKNILTVDIPKEFKTELDVMSGIFSEEYSIRLKPSKEGELTVKKNTDLDKEGYSILVKENGITMEASTTTGCSWAFQTLRQLLTLHSDGTYSIGCCKIEDKPAFPWRGFMQDVARSFKPKPVVKLLLDEMALLKMNVFHWHLTDNEGWRIEIDKYPALTGIGAWRDKARIVPYPRNNPRWDEIPPPDYSEKPYGGYYTKDDIREIVGYASQRHITVIPEIDMPGHCEAAIRAYPWLGAANEKGWSDALNVADERVVSFMEDVLREVIELFPCKVIHIGGDEVRQSLWQGNESIKPFMLENGYENLTDVHVNFMNQIAGFLEGSGRRLMGWNEIYGKNIHKGELKANDSNIKLNKEAIVHFWLGSPELLEEVTENGYDVVYSYALDTYICFNYDTLPLSKAYNTSPVPQGTNPEELKHILGLECHMWGEKSLRTIGFYPYIFPRLAAYAEVGWTNNPNKDYGRFTGSLWKLKKHWDFKGIYYNDRVD